MEEKSDFVVKNLDLEIKKGEFIGIVGRSGTGKTTLADIIMGLLPIDSGEIFVDDKKLNQINYNILRNLIGYVPQQINTLADTIKRNVAWGKEDSQISQQKVIEALKKAQLYDFVMLLEKGIDTALEVETSFSQGQKQRLGLARALYKDPDILILDEATSSLDVKTEQEIVEVLQNLKGEKTIIAIAHRLSTLKKCDRIIYIKEGKVYDSGSFEELSTRNEDFKDLVKLSNIDIR